MSVFEEAFPQTGIATDSGRLAVAAGNILARTDLSPARALARFCEILQTDPGLLRAVAADYLKQRAAEIGGERSTGRGLETFAVQAAPAPAGRPVGSDGDHTAVALASAEVSPSLPPQADRGGHACDAPARHDALSRFAPVHGGEGQAPGVSQAIIAPPVVKPNPPRGIDAIAAVQHVVARSVFDTFKVRGGRAIGDLGWAEAKSMARTNEREARVLRFVTDHVANARPGALIRDVVKAEVVEAAIRFATEAENAVA